MPRLQSFNGRYCEYEFENVFIGLLETVGWQYLQGGRMTRTSRREVLYADDMEQFLHSTNQNLNSEEIRQIMDKKIKEIIDTKSSFADWLNNQIVRDQLKFDIVPVKREE